MDLKAIRNEFPILRQEIYGRPLVYLDNAATTQKPQVVIDAVSQFYTTTNSNIHRGVHYLSEASSEAYERAREKVQRFLNAEDVSEIIFTSGTTDSINLVASSFGQGILQEGDEVIISEMEHHSNLIPWQRLCEQTGATLKVLPFDDNGRLRVDELTFIITPRTKLLAVTHVSNTLGTVNPVKEVIEIAHKHGVPVLIDGAQAVQHMPVDVQALDCEFYAFSGHKIYAETGIGVLYGKRDWLDRLPPCRSGGGMVKQVSIEKTTYADPPLKFEAGTVNYVGAVSLSVSIGYLTTIGLDAIQRHESALYQDAFERLNSIQGLTLYGASPGNCGAILFNLEGIHPYDVGMVLNRLGIAIRTGKHCAETVMQHYGIESALRASLAVYNTPEDMASLTEGLEKAQAMLAS